MKKQKRRTNMMRNASAVAGVDEVLVGHRMEREREKILRHMTAGGEAVAEVNRLRQDVLSWKSSPEEWQNAIEHLPF